MKCRNTFNQINGFLLTVILTAFVVAYFPVLKNLVLAWANSEEYSHGFFIIPICIYIIWTKHDLLATIPTRPSFWGLVLAVTSLVVYFLAYVAGISTLASITIVPLWAGIIAYLYGFNVLKALAFPLFLLFFMIPIPAQIYSSLTIPLQLFVSKISIILCSYSGIPIYGEGNIIYLPEKTLEVVEACSGLRSLITLLTLSLVYAYFSLKSNLLRIILIVSAIPIAIFVNIIRVMIIVLAISHFNIDLTADTYHTMFGLFIFLLALVIIAVEKGVIGKWDHPI